MRVSYDSDSDCLRGKYLPTTKAAIRTEASEAKKNEKDRAISCVIQYTKSVKKRMKSTKYRTYRLEKLAFFSPSFFFLCVATDGRMATVGPEANSNSLYLTPLQRQKNHHQRCLGHRQSRESESSSTPDFIKFIQQFKIKSKVVCSVRFVHTNANMIWRRGRKRATAFDTEKQKQSRDCRLMNRRKIREET